MTGVSPNFFTVLTPTFNRADLLKRVFLSLKHQSFSDFEWLIVDDGSTDNTRETVAAFMAEAAFSVRYIFQANGHKKVAFNRGVKNALGFMVVVLDDDDELPPNALATMHRLWHEIPTEQRDHFVGVMGLCARLDGTVVGDQFPLKKVGKVDPLATMDASATDLYFLHRVRGEKFGCQRTDVLRQFLYPEEIRGFVPESLVWWRIARAGYLNRCANHVLRIYHATPSSLSTGSSDLDRNAAGLYLLNWQLLQDELQYFFAAPRDFLFAAVRVVRFRLWLRGSPDARVLTQYPIVRWPVRWLVGLAWPIGWLLHRRDRRARHIPRAGRVD